jgi:hypothetical protein
LLFFWNFLVSKSGFFLQKKLNQNVSFFTPTNIDLTISKHKHQMLEYNCFQIFCEFPHQNLNVYNEISFYLSRNKLLKRETPPYLCHNSPLEGITFIHFSIDTNFKNISWIFLVLAYIHALYNSINFFPSCLFPSVVNDTLIINPIFIFFSSLWPFCLLVGFGEFNNATPHLHSLVSF